ncbi:MAG: HAD-IA family hydrolase [Nanoarchaeota archaeon]
MAIRYITFDIGGVANVEPREIVDSVKECFGEDFSDDRFKKMVHPPSWRAFQNGKISPAEYISGALKAGNLSNTPEHRFYLRQLLEEWCGKSYQPILDLVELLKQNGYHTSVLSNNNEIMYNTQGAEIRNRVDVSLSSHEIGISKPQPEAFKILLERIRADDPKEVLFIDNMVHNVDAAREQGLQAFYFLGKELTQDRAFEDLMGFLKRKGVRV